MQPEIMRRVVDSLKTGKVYHLSIQPKKQQTTVSDPTRRFFFGVVMQMISEETGHSAETLHAHFKRTLLGSTFDEHGIEVLPTVFSDESTMTVKEKWEYIDEIRRWAWDFINVAIPLPENLIE